MHKEMTNLEIADLLRNIAASYDIRDSVKNRFRVIAYERAADAVEHLSSEAKDIWDEGELENVSGIGESIAKHLDNIFRTGTSKHFESIIENIPMAAFELMKVPGIGPKRAYLFASEFKLSTKNPISSLRKYAEKGAIASLEGFGEDSEREILARIEEYSRKPENRMLLSSALDIANEILEWLKKDPSIGIAEPLGSLRRRASTVGDIDIAVASDNPERAMDHFVSFPGIKRVLERGEHSASVLLPSGVQVDLMVQPNRSFGSLLQHFTGSKHHNIALREFAIKKGLSLSEYGIKKINNKLKSKGTNQNSETQQFRTEKDFYNYLSLDWIPPELREDTGEIDSAQNGSLPKLIELSDIKGDLQIHSDFDIETSHDVGASSMKDIVKIANELGYEYIAFTEHNPSQKGHNNDQIIDLLKRKREKVSKINEELRVNALSIKRVFNSLEVDILPNGSLPVSDAALELLDFALVSIHSSFRQSKIETTKRVISALSHSKVKIFAHPTGRKLNQREGIELDWEKVFEHCLKHDKWVEINADPSRLDLPDFLVKEAVKHGVKITIGTDAHSTKGLHNMHYGVYVARRGWSKKHDIINTRNLKDFQLLISNS